MKVKFERLTLAHAIRFLKNSGGLSTADIAANIGISKSLVSFIERGYIPAKEQIKADILSLYSITKSNQKELKTNE